ncbi:MAG: acyltransferase [Phycisphaerales bacterium]|nr:MAG: acyltransferase [Phycisphaerales bacterium]
MGPDASQLVKDRIVDEKDAVSVPLPVQRITSIDGLRILAAVGIVWFHTDGAPYRYIGYTGLPIFLLIFFSLITHRSGTDPARYFFKRRWNRLVMPWLFWSLLYGALRIIKGACSGEASSFQAMLSLETVLAGTHVHLWYLPYAFVSGFLVYALNRWTLRFSHVAVVLIATGVGLSMLVVNAAGLFSFGLRCPVPQWEFGLAAVPLGFAIGRCLMISSSWWQRALLSAIFVLTQVTSLALIASGHVSSTVPYSLAVTLVCLAYCWRSGGSVIIAKLAPLTFGIYLIHPLVSRGLASFTSLEQHWVGFVGLTACVSGLITLGMMRTPLRKLV